MSKKSKRPATFSSHERGIAHLFLLFVVILVAIGAVGYLAYQNAQLNKQAGETTTTPESTDQQASEPTSSPETSNWEIYTNSEYGFTVKYPPNWKYLEVPTQTYQTESDQVWFDSSEFPPPQTDARADLVIVVTDVDPSTNWQPQYFNDYKSEPYNLGNVSANKISGVNKESLYEESVIIAKINNFYIQVLSNRSPNSNKYFDEILSTFTFLVGTNNLELKPAISPPPNWKLHKFADQDIKIYLPNDWDSNIEIFPNIPSSLITMWKKGWDFVPVQMNIKNNWDNTGNAKSLPKNEVVGNNINAARVDPPKKEEKTLERYQTNVYFEHKGKVYIFTCVHNWEDDTLDTCNGILKYLNFDE